MNRFKDLRKAAFAVGFGFTMGKAVAGLAETVLNGAVLGVISLAAKHGNKIAQEVCEKGGIEIESEKEDETKIKMGFHCE